MLHLTRKTGQAIRIGQHTLRIKRITPTKVELYIDVAADVRVVRGEIVDAGRQLSALSNQRREFHVRLSG